MRRVCVLLASVLTLLVGSIGFGGSAAQAAEPVLTRVRLTLSSTSEFASLRFYGTYIAAHYVASVDPPSASVTRGRDLILLKDASPASTTVDLVLSVPTGASPVLILEKGREGQAAAQVVRRNTTAARIAEMTNTEQSGSDYTVSRSISRSRLVGEGLTIPLLDPRRLVLAFYYPWFNRGRFDSGAWYDRPVGPYDTGHPAEVAAMVDQAADFGIDGFVFSWDARYDRPQRFQYLLDAARARGGFVVAPVLELMTWRRDDGTFDVTSAVAAAALALGRASHPAFLRLADGRPVLFAFGAQNIQPLDWQAVEAGLRGRGYDFFSVGDASDIAYGFDGSYFYNPNRYTQRQLANQNVAWSWAMRLPAQVDPHVPQRLWAATVSPGQNMSYLNPVFPNHVDREDGARYDGTWNAALPSAPEWVLVTSWNEWYEATHVAPSERFGYRALWQTKGWSGYFKNPTPSGSSDDDGGDGILPLRFPVRFPAALRS